MNYTENNSIAMKTVVETFVIEETEALIYDNEKLEKWNDHVAALGLAGQTKVAKPEKSPIPFLCLNMSLQEILNELCPRHVNVKEYDKTPIPVEILDLVALSVREEYFQDIQVWYDDRTPDPAVVGLVGHWYEIQWYDNSNRSIREERFKTESEAKEAGAKHPTFQLTSAYLLGKWGDVKQSFDELRERAVKRFISRNSAELNKRIKDAQREMDDLQHTAFERFGASEKTV